MFAPAIVALIVVSDGIAADSTLLSQAQAVLKSSDASISGTFDLAANPALLDGLLRSPMLLARLWEVYGFTPLYKARVQGNAIHVDDPTGITGEVYPIEHSMTRHVFYGTGALNHKLVPAFRGRLALVLTAAPKGAGVSARVDVYIRTESRFLGFFASTLFPLVRARAQHRMEANMQDIATLLKDVTTAPRQTAARLKKEDADALLRLFPEQVPAQKPAGPPPKPASKPVSKPGTRPKQ